MLRRHLKKYFIPHEENEYKPHFLRSKTAALVLGVVFFVEILFLLQTFVVLPNSSFLASVLPSVLVADTNAGREAHSLSALEQNQLLQEAAQLKANDMAAKGYFSHDSPDGKTPWYWLQQVGYNYEYAGENLAVNFVDSQDVMTAWMNSPTHRANILNDKFSEIGIATSKGTYKGREAVFVVQFFGTPALALAPVTPHSAVSGNREMATASATVPAGTAGFSTGSVAVAAEPSVEGTTTVRLPETTVTQPSLIGELLAKPRSTTAYVLYAIFALVACALILKIFIKIRIQHPQLIVNGVVLLLFIGLALLANNALAGYHAAVF